VTEPEVTEPEWFLAEVTGTEPAWPESTGYAVLTACQASGSGDARGVGCDRVTGGDAWMTSAYGRSVSGAMTQGTASDRGIETCPECVTVDMKKTRRWMYSRAGAVASDCRIRRTDTADSRTMRTGFCERE
jgi:hypothetical protein